MEDSQSNLSCKLDKLPQIFCNTDISLQGPHNLEMAKPFILPGGLPPATQELPPETSNSILDPDSFLFSNKEDNIAPIPNEIFQINLQHQDFEIPQNQEKHSQLDGVYHFNLSHKFEEYPQEFNNVGRSRGISFFSDQETRENDRTVNPDFDLLYYISNHGNQDVEHSKEGVKVQYEQNILGFEEEDNGLGINTSNAVLAKKLAQYVQSKHLHKILQDDNENTLETNTPTQVDEQRRLARKFTESSGTLGREIRKKRKVSERRYLALTEKRKKSQTPQKRILKSTNRVRGFLPLTPQVKKKPRKTSTPRVSTKMTSRSVQGMIIENVLGKSATKEKEETIGPENEEPTGINIKTENSVSVQQMPLLDPLKGCQIKSHSFEKLFFGLQLPVEVEELISKSKIFTNLCQQKVKKIGPLTYEERKMKVEKYLRKRKEKTWGKRINYDCRKRVAEARLRVKGRFVTKAQAFGMLEAEGIHVNKNQISEAEMKSLLENIFEKRKNKGEDSGKKKSSRAKKVNEVEVKAEHDSVKTAEPEIDEEKLESSSENSNESLQ